MNSEIILALERWFQTHCRILPWRERHADPYAVWVSEIMLQQTRVSVVIPYYERWMSHFPDVETLASSPMEDALSLWSGLGYYARARNLHDAAGQIVSRFGGRIPRDLSDLLSLPGIGRYTAGAILSIAFNEPVSLLDANVTRVLARLLGMMEEADTVRGQSILLENADRFIFEAVTYGAEPWIWNQALMELGALVCNPSDPECETCPLLSSCTAGQSENPAFWPVLSPRKRTVHIHHCSLILRDLERFLIVRRPPHGLWGGLWEFPRLECHPGERADDCAVRIGRDILDVSIENAHLLCKVRHTVMHYSIELWGYMAQSDHLPVKLRGYTEMRWVRIEEFFALPIASPQRQLGEKLEAYSAHDRG
jgi:A/G-specific adenine glycosylase